MVLSEPRADALFDDSGGSARGEERAIRRGARLGKYLVESCPRQIPILFDLVVLAEMLPRVLCASSCV